MASEAGNDSPHLTCDHPSTAWLRDILAASGSGRPRNRFDTWQCPGHADETPSLRVSDGRVGAVLYCHAGCPPEHVLAALSLALRDLYEPPPFSPEEWLRFAGVHPTYPPMVLSHGSNGDRAAYRHECFHYYGPNHRLERRRHKTDPKRKTLTWERLDGAVLAFL